MACTTPTAYDLDLCPQDELPGSKPFISWAFWDDVNTHPTLVASPANFADRATTASASNLVAKTGKRIYRADMIEFTGSLEEKLSGPDYGKSFEYTVKFRVLNNAAGLGFIDLIRNKRLVIVYHHANGEMQLLGSTDFWVKFSEGSATTGSKTGDERYREYSFVFGPTKAPYYVGTISYAVVS